MRRHLGAARALPLRDYVPFVDGTALGEAVAAGWDTDCNGATVGGLCGLSGAPIDVRWTTPSQGRIGTRLAGHSELQLEDGARPRSRESRAFRPA